MITNFMNLNRDLLDVDWRVLQNRGADEMREVSSSWQTCCKEFTLCGIHWISLDPLDQIWVEGNDPEDKDLYTAFFYLENEFLESSQMTYVIDWQMPSLLVSKSFIEITTLNFPVDVVEKPLRHLNESSVLGPNEISHLILRRCSSSLAPPLSKVFTIYIDMSLLPKQ